MSYLNPIVLSQALPIMGKALGLKVSEDKPEIISEINRMREYWFTKYDEFELFNRFECICVTQFKELCGTGCCNEYNGFTLPAGFDSVEAIYDYGYPVTLHSRWRESHFGLGTASCSRTNATEMAQTFPTERDLKEPSALKIFTEREEDDEKCVRVTVVTVHGKETTLTFKLDENGWVTSRTKVKKIISVSLPPERVGSIKLAQNDGYVLSEYAPWESAPQYKRFKLNQGCCKHAVLVHGRQSFRPIYFDHEIVEIGNGLIIEAFGKYSKFGDNTSDGNELQTGQYWLNEMKSLLNGLIARHRGNAIQDANPLQDYKVRKTKLPGYAKR